MCHPTKQFQECLKAGILWLLAVAGLVTAWTNASQSAGKDFYQFWVFGQSANRPGINIYANETWDRLGGEFLEKAKQSANPRLLTVAQYRQSLQAYSSPFLYALFRSFSTGNYDVDLRNYRLLMLGSLIFGTMVLCRLLNYSWVVAPGLIAVLSIWFDPLTSDLFVGNINCLQFAALAAYLWIVTRMPWRHRDFAGGVLLSAIVAFKPNLVFVAGVLVFHWLLNGRFRCLLLHAAGAVVGGAGVVLFSAMSFHSLRCWGEWLSALHSLPANVILASYGNASPLEIFCESFHLNVAIPLAVILIGLSIVILSSWRHNASGEGNTASAAELSDVFAVSLGCLLVIIAARLAWFHYYVLAIPAFLFVLQSTPKAFGASSARLVWSRLLAIVAFACLTPLSSLATPLFADPQAVLAASAALLLFLSLAIFPAAPKPATQMPNSFAQPSS